MKLETLNLIELLNERNKLDFPKTPLEDAALAGIRAELAAREEQARQFKLPVQRYRGAW